jgi:hypothetical protein
VEKIKVTCPCRESYPDVWANQPSVHHYTDRAIRLDCNRSYKPIKKTQTVTPVMTVTRARDVFLDCDKALSVITCFREVSFRLSQRPGLPFRLLPKDVKIKVQKIAITCCFYGGKVWSLALWKELDCESLITRFGAEYLDLRGRKQYMAGENWIMNS